LNCVPDDGPCKLLTCGQDDRLIDRRSRGLGWSVGRGNLIFLVKINNHTHSIKYFEPDATHPRIPASPNWPLCWTMTMNPPSLPTHRSIPTFDEIMQHELRPVVQHHDLNSIKRNAVMFSDFSLSTSNWNEHHIIAFHILDFNDLPVESVYPLDFLPPLDDPVVAEVGRLFTLSNKEIRTGKLDFRRTGAAFSFYRTLQDCLRTQKKTPSPTQPSVRPTRNPLTRVPLHQYTVSDSSGSSFFPSTSSMDAIPANPASQDKAETVTNFLLINYLYLLAELENASSGRGGILFTYVQMFLFLMYTVQIVITLAL
jgi:hypothetical protein